MRLSSATIILAAFVIGAVLSLFGARAAVSAVEDRSTLAVRTALDDAGLTWASVQSDGLLVILEGEAPTEAMAYRATTVAGTQVDAARVDDVMTVAVTQDLAPPHFSVEILHNDAGVSIIGLIPAAQDRDVMLAGIAEVAGVAEVADLLQVADYPTPAGWNRAFDYGLRALEALPRSQISISADAISITGNTDSEAARAEIEAALSRRVPEGIDIALTINAPRPVITPFTLRFVMDDTGTRFDACSADTAATAATILAAARSAGWNGADDLCTLGLGMPSNTWGDAVALAIATLDALGGGAVTFSDADVTLVALEGTAQALFDREIGELENALPEVFALFPILPAAPEAGNEGPPDFTATRSPEGDIQLRGRVSSDLMNDAAANFARARLGSDDITIGTRTAEGLPADWTVRVLAGIEALAELSNGAVVVTPDLVTITGNTGSRNAQAELARLLSEKLGSEANFEIEVTYVEQLDPIAGQPTAEECIERIIAVTDQTKITFEPGSATIEGSVRPAIDAIAEILKRCTDKRIEIAGYTDSQGREIMNAQLSQERAQAVLAALRARRVPTSNFRAIGYGEADPIADNDTADGREANRRIEFRLIVPESSGEEETGLEALEDDMPEADAPEGEAGEDTEGEGETSE